MLTANQIVTLRAAIIADAAAHALQAAGNLSGLLAWCNGASSTLAWLTATPVSAAEEAPTYTTYDSLAAGKRDSWLVFLRNSRDFTKAKIRNWVTDVWGNATAGSNAEAVLLAGTVAATNAQLVFGGPSRTTGTVTAIARNWEGVVSETECKRLIWKDDGTIWQS